jgi:hypothetical protein
MKYFFIVTFLLISCQHSFEPIETKSEALWISATARINGYKQIVLIDYRNPAKFKLLTNDQNQNFYSKFSNDRRQLIYLKEKPENTAGRRLVRYSLNGKYAELIDSTFAMIHVVGNIPVIWSPDDSRIYFRFRSFSWSDDPMYYDFYKNKTTFLINTPDPSEYVVAFKGSDTLIVFSNDTSTTHAPSGFYYMDLNGSYLSFIDNPHLELINRNGVNLKSALHPDWNNKLGLFVYAQIDSTYPGYKIAITDLKGKIYKTYTSGEYIDDYPVWGPDDHIVFFHRQPINDYDGFNKRLMILNLKNGEVRDFLDPASINNATALGYPDY